MSINDLYLMLTTGHIRLPYWFIAITIFAFFILLIVLLVVWMQKRKCHRLYVSTNGKLKKVNLEMYGLVSKLTTKDEEIVSLNNSKSAISKKLVEKEKQIKGLNKNILTLQASLDENMAQYKTCESEKIELLSKLKAKEEGLVKLNDSITLANDSIQRGNEEKGLLMKRVDSIQELLSQKIKLFEILEEKYNQEKCQNRELERSKKLLEKELESLEKRHQLLINIHESEIRKLNSKLERRGKEIEKLNDSLVQTDKELQATRDEKLLIEKTLEEIQKRQITKEQDISKNIIEKIAKW